MRKFLLYIFIIIYLILFVFTMRLHTFKIFPDKDTGVFLYIGELVSENKVPYKDSWDHKPPLIYFLNALIFKFFPKEIISITIFECFWIIFTIILVYLFCRNIWDFKTSFLTSILFALYFSNMSFPQCYGMTETYLVLPAILAVFLTYLSIKKNSLLFIFLAGIFASLSFLFKQTGVSVIIPVLFFILLSDIIIKRKIYFTSFFFLGFVLPISIFFVYFLLTDCINDFISQVFIYNFLYINLLKKSFFFNFTESFLFKRPILLFVFIGSIIIFVINYFLDKNHIKKNKLFFVLLIWIISDFYFISISKRYYQHYLVQLISPMTLLSGFLFDFILKNTKIYISIILLIMMFIISGATSNMEYALRFNMKNKDFIKLKYGSYTGYYHDIINWILDNTSSEDYIYFFGTETRLHFITKRKCPTKYSYIYPLINYKYATKKDFNIFLSDLAKNKPKYIIDSMGFFDTNAGTPQAQKFMQQLSSFGFDDAISIYFNEIIHFINTNYKDVGLLGTWKIMKLKV